MNEKQRKAVWFGAMAVFLGFMAAAGWFIGVPMIRLVEDPEQFRSWVDSYGFWGRVIFVGMVALQVVVAFIPGEPVELAAGYAFGFIEGSLLTLLGFLIGSMAVFLLVRRIGVSLVEVFFSRSKIRQFQFLKNPKKTKVLALVLMVIPGTPKDFLSYFAGLTKLSLGHWLLIVAVGRLPSLLTSTATGAAAGEEQYLLSVIMLAVTVGISLAGIVYYRILTKQEHMQEGYSEAA